MSKPTSHSTSKPLKASTAKIPEHRESSSPPNSLKRKAFDHGQLHTKESETGGRRIEKGTKRDIVQDFYAFIVFLE
jgi:hypothetical protein